MSCYHPNVHPFLFAIFPILFFLSQNIYQTSPREALIPFVVSLSATALLLGVLTIITKAREKSALVVSLFVILFFSFGHARTALDAVSPDSFDFGRDRVVLALFSVIFAAGILGIIKLSEINKRFSRALSVIALALVLFQVGNITFYLWRHRDVHAAGGEGNTILGAEKKPSIYYIILDGYARADTLKELYSYDNTDFLAALEKRGFYIASKSHSNYSWTHVSLASSLNMTHVTSFTQSIGADSEDRALPFQMIEDNEIARLLKNQGYTYMHISSGLNRITATNKNADIVFSGGKLDEFSRGFLKTTALYPFIRQALGVGAQGRVLYSFDSVERASQLDGPRFIFAHIILPHPPFIFGPHGESVTDPSVLAAGENVWKFKDRYRDQVIFANSKIIAMVDAILRNEKVTPIIIIQGDHGPGSEGGDTDFDVLTNPSDSLIKERMSILNTYHFPGDGVKNLYKEITPVNSFRILFNTYLGGHFDLLEDRSFISPDRAPYNFREVTEILKSR